MTVSSDVLLGLAAALGFGIADFLARQVTQRLGYVSTLFLLQTIGSLVLVPLALVYERPLWQAGDPWLLILALGVLNLLAALALYRALEYGVLSVVAPVTSMAPAASAVLALVLLGERPTSPTLVGIVLVLGGVVALSRTGVPVSGPPPKDARGGLVSALLSVIGFGALGVGLKTAAGSVGPITTIVTIRFVGVAAMLVGSLTGVVRVVRPGRDLWPLVLAVTAVDTAAFVAFTTGIHLGSVTIVATLSSLFSAVTVGLAALFLGERLTSASYVSIGVVLVGVVLIVRG